MKSSVEVRSSLTLGRWLKKYPDTEHSTDATPYEHSSLRCGNIYFQVIPKRRHLQVFGEVRLPGSARVDAHSIRRQTLTEPLLNSRDTNGPIGSPDKGQLLEQSYSMHPTSHPDPPQDLTVARIIRPHAEAVGPTLAVDITMIVTNITSE